MADVLHDASASAKSDDVSSLSVALTIAANADRYLIVYVFAATTGGTPPGAFSGVTWNTSENLTLLWTSNDASDKRLECWGLANPTATSANVVATFGSTPNSGCAVAASSYYNVDQTTPTGATQTTGGDVFAGGVMWFPTDVGGGATAGSRVVAAAGLENVSATLTITDVDGIPEWLGVGTLSVSAAVTSRTPAKPTLSKRGDLLVAVCTSENNATHSCATTGWNKLGQTNSGASHTTSWFWAIETAAGLGAPAITWSGSVDARAIVYQLRDTKADGTPLALHGTVGTGTGATHSSTGANSTDDDVRVIYIDSCNANTGLGAPASWTENNDQGSATGPCRLTLGGRDLTTSGSGSGNISVTGGAAAWVQRQIEVYQADNGDQTQRTEQESLQGGSPNYGLVVSDEVADTFNAFGWTCNSLNIIGNQVYGAIVLNAAAAAGAAVLRDLAHTPQHQAQMAH